MLDYNLFSDQYLSLYDAYNMYSSFQNYNPIISSYSSIFELSVGMNFAYTASRPFRKAMKDGFLQNIRNIEKWYDEKIIEVSGMIMLMNDIDEESKANIKKELDESLLELKKEDERLHQKILDTQSKIADETKPIYIYTAFFSLIVLFLGGQEAAHSRFPKEGMQILLISTLFFYVVSSIFKRFFKTIVTGLDAVIFTILVVFLVLFVDYNSLSKYICNKYLLDAALITAFLPFVFSAGRLALLNIQLFWFVNENYKKLQKKLSDLKKHAEDWSRAKEFFQKNGKAHSDIFI